MTETIVLLILIANVYLCIRVWDNHRSIHNLHLKINNMATITDVQDALTDLQETVSGAINDKDARIAELEAQLAEALSNAADPVVLDSIVAQIQAIKAPLVPDVVPPPVTTSKK